MSLYNLNSSVAGSELNWLAYFTFLMFQMRFTQKEGARAHVLYVQYMYIVQHIVQVHPDCPSCMTVEQIQI